MPSTASTTGIRGWVVGWSQSLAGRADVRDVSTLNRGDLVWWHEDGRPADPARQGRVDRVEPGPHHWVYVIAGGDVQTIKIAPIYVHPTTSAIPVSGCSLCFRDHSPAEISHGGEAAAFRC